MKGTHVMGRPKILKPMHPLANREASGSKLSGIGSKTYGNKLDAGYMSQG
jgi:hypothetical protein